MSANILFVTVFFSLTGDISPFPESQKYDPTSSFLLRENNAQFLVSDIDKETVKQALALSRRFTYRSDFNLNSHVKNGAVPTLSKACQNDTQQVIQDAQRGIQDLLKGQINYAVQSK